MKLIKYLKGEKLSPTLELKFKNVLLAENSRRLFVLVICVALIESLLFISVAIGLIESNAQAFILQLVIVIICIFLLITLYFLKKYKKYVILSVISVFAYMFCLVMACVFSALGHTEGHVTYAAFFVGLLIVSIIFIKKLSTSILFYFMALISLSIYATLTFPVNVQLITEIINAAMFVILLCIGTVLNYNRNKKMFLQEERIKDANTKLKLLSITDELTGLYNRRRVYEELEREIDSAQRYQKPLSIILLDIDNFKSINDDCGHNVGDAVLKEFAHILKQKLRTTDIIGRWGGEEFIIVCTNTCTSTAFILADRLCKVIENYKFVTTYNVTFSAGVSQFKLGEKPLDMIGRADEALYSAKTDGRNCVKEIS